MKRGEREEGKKEEKKRRGRKKKKSNPNSDPSVFKSSLPAS